MIKDCHVGIKGIVCINNQCLVLQKGIGDNAFWDVPGGRIDGQEKIEDTLHRELHEEVPTIGEYSVCEIVGAYRIEKDLEGDRGLILIFYKVETQEFEVTLSPEHHDYKWVSKETLPELRNSDMRIASELYKFLEKVLD